MQIPEFEKPYQKEEYEKRLKNCKHLVLVAYDKNTPVGFKIGYEREKGSFYTWMGGVLPKYRKHGVAKELAKKQEAWAKEQGYKLIKLKTRNKYKSMLQFAISSGFNITCVEEINDVENYRILLEKKI